MPGTSHQIRRRNALWNKSTRFSREYGVSGVILGFSLRAGLTHSERATAAKAALQKKKHFEHALTQTQGQIMTLEREIYSIETANINKETLEAMKNASKAMKEIHGGLTIDKVDQTMYVQFLWMLCMLGSRIGLCYLRQLCRTSRKFEHWKRKLTDKLSNPQGRTPRTTRYWRRNRRGYHAVHR